MEEGWGPYEEVLFENSFITNGRGMKLFTCRWLPSVPMRGLVFLCHGYGMCSVYNRETGLRLARAGYIVYGIDYEGHGRSEGLQCYIANFDDLVTDCASFFNAVMDREEYFGQPRFLFGESMGGAVATLVSRRDPTRWNGLVLLAPMCKISEKIKPPAVVVSVLKKLCYFIPTWKIVPGGDVIDSAFKDPIKRAEIRANPYSYRGVPRLKTAVERLRASTDVEEHLHEMSLPFLCLHGEADRVTDPEISRTLYNTAVSLDKTLKMYPGMWHGLTTGEPDQNVDLVFSDMISWLHARSDVSSRSLSPHLLSTSSIVNRLDSNLSSEDAHDAVLRAGLQAEQGLEIGEVEGGLQQASRLLQASRN